MDVLIVNKPPFPVGLALLFLGGFSVKDLSLHFCVLHTCAKMVWKLPIC